METPRFKLRQIVFWRTNEGYVNDGYHDKHLYPEPLTVVEIGKRFIDTPKYNDGRQYVAVQDAEGNKVYFSKNERFDSVWFIKDPFREAVYRRRHGKL